MIILGDLLPVRFTGAVRLVTLSNNRSTENGEFDDIVVGSGFCALAYVDQALRQNPFRKILILERGGKYDHVAFLLILTIQ